MPRGTAALSSRTRSERLDHGGLISRAGGVGFVVAGSGASGRPAGSGAEDRAIPPAPRYFICFHPIGHSDSMQPFDPPLAWPAAWTRRTQTAQRRSRSLQIKAF